LGAFLLGLTCLLTAVTASSIAQGAAITVINRDAAGEGFNDPTPVAPVGGNSGTTIGAQRLNAFQFAANLWGALIDSAAVIRVGANFDPLSCSSSSAILGSAGPANIVRDFVGAPIANTWFPIALANALHGSELNPGADDITATFNSSIGTTCAFPLPWYYGLDASPPGSQIDFVTVVVHELGHGLGFLTLVNLTSGAKLGGFNDVYMLNLEDHTTGKLYPNMTDAERAAANTNTSNLHWIGPQVRAASGVLTAGRVNDHVQMFAPNPAQPGSSLSHFDTALTPNEAMEPIYTVPLHSPGLAVPLFHDIGWTSSGSSTAALAVTKTGTGSGTVTSSPPGINCGTTCSANFATGTPVTLTASAASGSTFVGWSGACSGTGTCVVTPTTAATVTATFNTSSTSFSLTVTKAGTGNGTVTSSPAGISCGSACSAIFNNGTVTLTASADAGSTFAGWSGACSGTGTCSIATNVNTSVTATFTAATATFPLSVTKTGVLAAFGTVTSSPSGINCGSTCSANYASGTRVTLTASPASFFAGWSGPCSGTGSCSVTPTAATTVTATFAFSTGTNTLTVTKAGTGSGTVTSSPAGISCGATCSASFASNIVVALTASPAAGSTFAGWSGACSGTGGCSVTMTTATAVTATFNASSTTFALAVTRAGTGSGTVTSSPTGISCGPTCSASFASRTVVTLTATPAPGSTFAGWSGACSGSGTCSVTMNAATTVTATFTSSATTFALSVTKTGTGGGIVTSSPAGITCGTTCSASFVGGTVVSLTVTPASRSIFVGWSGACSGTGSCTVTMTASQAVVAIFLGF
jgi:hypothetical protein